MLTCMARIPDGINITRKCKQDEYRGIEDKVGGEEERELGDVSLLTVFC